ncbi:kinase-like protein [Yamadazyma tenuis ATCC 10573]|nr:kinase-like protein [Yamadazyma tenuis ATCC 10573]EGV62086.1 kinase-like protein [Yamadazyma tenuis ATCC 10573]
MKDLHYKIQLEYKDYKDNVPMCWKLISKWLQIYETDLRQNFLQHGIKDEDIFLTEYEVFKAKVFEYRDWLFTKYERTGFASNFKFCHNDTQYGNLLLHESFNPGDIIVGEGTSTGVKNTSNKRDTSLVVIDFEYGGANFPAFDLVNHFSEWMANYHDPEKSYFLDESRYPTKLEQLNLIKAYIEYDFQYPSSNLKVDSEPDITKVTPAELIEFEIKKIYDECVFWRASVQVYWCIWGLIQNGPFKQKDIVEQLGATSLERGVDGTYTITTGLTSVELNESTIEDEITSADDEFNYIKYSQQKAALAIGDFISHGLFDQSSLSPQCQHLVKTLDSSVFGPLE